MNYLGVNEHTLLIYPRMIITPIPQILDAVSIGPVLDITNKRVGNLTNLVLYLLILTPNPLQFLSNRPLLVPQPRILFLQFSQSLLLLPELIPVLLTIDPLTVLQLFQLAHLDLLLVEQVGAEGLQGLQHLLLLLLLVGVR